MQESQRFIQVMGADQGSCRQPLCVTNQGIHMYNLLHNAKGYMNTITYSAARAGLAQTMKKVCKDHEPVIIVCCPAEDAVLIAQLRYHY